MRKFNNTTEMEVTLRVCLYVMEAIDGLEVKVSGQPARQSHRSFTDFHFILETREKPLCFIEVKRSDLSININSQTNAVAQTLREAQIVLTSRWDEPVTSIPFILTNSREWSFGLAVKDGPNIKVTHTYTLFLPSSVGPLMKCLKALVQGSHPQWDLSPPLTLP